MAVDLFTSRNKLQPVLAKKGNDGMGCEWGNGLDYGRLVYIDTVELLDSYRGRGVLLQLLPQFVAATGADCIIGMIGEPRSLEFAKPRLTPQIDKLEDMLFPLSDAPRAKKKIATIKSAKILKLESDWLKTYYRYECKMAVALRKLGFRRIGKTLYFATVCKDPGTMSQPDRERLPV